MAVALSTYDCKLNRKSNKTKELLLNQQTYFKSKFNTDANVEFGFQSVIMDHRNATYDMSIENDPTNFNDGDHIRHVYEEAAKVDPEVLKSTIRDIGSRVENPMPKHEFQVSVLVDSVFKSQLANSGVIGNRNELLRQSLKNANDIAITDLQKSAVLDAGNLKPMIQLCAETANDEEV